MKYNEIYDAIVNDPEWISWMNIIKSNPYKDPKLNAEHGADHAKNVCTYGEKFLAQAMMFSPEEERERTCGLFKIAAALHDIGMITERPEDHASVSAGMASEYLTKYDLSSTEIAAIIKAIRTHSIGTNPTDLLDAALILADKLDVSYERFINKACLDDRRIGRMIREQRKISHVRYDLMRPIVDGAGNFQHYKTARLTYMINPTGDAEVGNNTPYKVKCLAEWPKCLIVPRNVSLHTLECEEFQFVVNNVLIDVDAIIR